MFQNYKRRIASDFNMQHASDSQIWESLVEKMVSWRRKSGLTKQSRWFSWNEQAELQLCEFWASRMVLEWYLCDQCPLPEESSRPEAFKASFKETSGLKLMYQCLTQMFFQDAWTIYLVQCPLWQFFSEQVHFIKSPTDGLTEVLRLVNEWWRDSHLLHLASLVGRNNFSELQWLAEDAEDKDLFAKTFLDYLLTCLGNRCGTFAKFATPPFVWATALSEDDALRATAMGSMKSDWRRLLLLECSQAPLAGQLCQDLRLTFGPAERLLVQVAESLNWDLSGAPCARDLLKQLVGGFADSKVVEDIHQRLRNATNTKANEKLNGSGVQTMLQGSDVLEKRGIPHPCALSKEDFLQLWGVTRDDFKPRVDFKASGHKLPKEFSRILGEKTWPTISEEHLTKSAAGWAWLRHYLDTRLSDHGFQIQDFCYFGLQVF